tara:strand:+ start:74 stop:343 length:270 start_codon:yes stop_codon:yes gene_type:complete
MIYILNIIATAILLVLIVLAMQYYNNLDTNKFSSYYNTEGAYAGFIQKKGKLFRACEFSTNGSILSCSKWFDDDNLKQGQNIGLEEEEI